METKKLIRNELLMFRNSLTEQDVQTKSEQISKKLIGLANYQQAELLLVYMDYKKEVMTSEIILDALQSGKLVYLPKIVDQSMEFYQIQDLSEVQTGYFGIQEPFQKEDSKFHYFLAFEQHKKILMIMPGVGFDLNRNRIGYGKGFYDRYLSNKPELDTIAIGFECQLRNNIPAEFNDIRPKCLITETRIL